MIALDTVRTGDGAEALRLLDDESVQVVMADPPYGVGLQTSQHLARGRRFEEIEGAYEVNPTWIPEAYRATRQGGALFCFAKWTNAHVWRAHIEAAGYKVRNYIVWDKLQHGSGDVAGAFAPQHEFILFATRGQFRRRGARTPDVIRLPKVHPTQLRHPYEKPVALIELLLLAASDPGDLMADPCCGIGTSALAARRIGRRYFVNDIDPHWTALARAQLSHAYVAAFDVCATETGT